MHFEVLYSLNRALDRIRVGEVAELRRFIDDRHESEEKAYLMAHSFKYQITESVRVVEIEVGKLLDLATMLKDDGNDALSTTVSDQANKLLEASVALRIAMAG